ncbi:MAG: hypothetical protein ACLFQ3_06625 [Thiohalorhabdus sp.]
MNLNGGSFDCENCIWGRHCDEEGELEGSRGPAPFVKWEIEHGGAQILASRTCPKPMVTEQSTGYLRLYNHYERSVLPYSGGLLQQPAAYLEAMEVIESAVNEHQRQQAERWR